jgi:DNA-binding HxlR family transcriptional regulator
MGPIHGVRTIFYGHQPGSLDQLVREAMLGVRRFSEFQRRLGLARNMLSTRLKRLLESGVMELVPASDGTSYQEYVLTEKGKSLWPVLNAIRQWGQQYLFQPGEERTELLDKKHHKALKGWKYGAQMVRGAGSTMWNWCG